MQKKSNVISFVASEKTQEMMSEELNWCMRDKTPQYAKWQAKDGDTVITLYESGKVVFQGKDADLASDFWVSTEKINSGKVDVKNSSDKKTSSKEKINYVNPKIYYSSSIGSDEVGTGDYFGPIVVTGAYISKEQISFIEKLGVKDSKQLTDEKIMQIAPALIKEISHTTLILNNTDYNNYQNKGFNMNKIKAILHNKVLVEMQKKHTDYDKIVVDQFVYPSKYFEHIKDAKEKVTNISFYTKAESICPSVAVASCISRYIFLKKMEEMSDELHIPVLKGAGIEVDKLAAEIVKTYGKEKLYSIAKLNFKNTEKLNEYL